jgi:hypothetical protein
MLTADAMTIPATDPIIWLNTNGASLWERPKSSFGTRTNAQTAARIAKTILTIFIQLKKKYGDCAALGVVSGRVAFYRIRAPARRWFSDRSWTACGEKMAY